MSAPKPRALGRGLDALLGGSPTSAAPPPPETATRSDVFSCALEKIVPNRGQPRRHFEEKALEELAQSIREHGLIEALVVRRIRGEDRFEIVAGERRWRASQRAGLREVLVIVKELDDKKAFEIALIENVQREDLNAIEFAEALRVLLDDHGHTQESLAQAVGKDRTTITNALRLLKLPEAVRKLVIHGELSEGHGRAILGAPDDKAMLRIAELAAKKKLSVRQTEAEVRAVRETPKGKLGKSASTKDLELRLARKLGARCEVKDRDGKGELVVHYGDLDELDRILDLIL
ncbi:MAG: chromosome partitioning protein ParB [Pseudomonadota bacterium]|jgi:ParB family chromosome partitioning protein